MYECLIVVVKNAIDIVCIGVKEYGSAEFPANIVLGHAAAAAQKFGHLIPKGIARVRATRPVALGAYHRNQAPQAVELPRRVFTTDPPSAQSGTVLGQDASPALARLKNVEHAYTKNYIGGSPAMPSEVAADSPGPALDTLQGIIFAVLFQQLRKPVLDGCCARQKSAYSRHEA